jgi:DNA-binding MarR family transcriptional regulator
MDQDVDSFAALFELIGRLARRRYRQAERAYAQLGLDHTEARLLRRLGEAGGATDQEDLTGALYVDRTNAGRALQRLETAGLLTRQKTQADRRRNHVRITPQGQRTARDLARLRRGLIKTFCGELSPADAAAAYALLSKVGDNETLV